jgi:nucleoid DNA-binding protein
VSTNDDKYKLDRVTAASLLVDRREVRVITQEWIAQLRKLLAQEEAVTIDGLGRFRVQRCTPHTASIRNLVAGTFKPGESAEAVTVEASQYSRVHFSQSGVLKRMLNKEPDMEKYAVDESVNQEKLEKVASKGCPECGAGLTKHGSVLLCPTHGSAPFEVPQQGGNNGSEKTST